MNVTVPGCDDVDWIHVAQDRERFEDSNEMACFKQNVYNKG